MAFRYRSGSDPIQHLISYNSCMNIQSKIFFIFFGLVLNSITDAFAIEIFEGGRNDCRIQVFQMSGDIKRGDSIIFANAIHVIKDQYQHSCKEKKKNITPFFNIQLNSSGGEVEEAIKIGEIIRKSEFNVSVPDGAECLSSCIFILSAGVLRSAYGRVGIHRPYFSSLSKDENVQNIKNKREAILTSIKQYLEEMDVNPRLVDTMISIPPGELKILTPDELSYYRLTGIDANYEEKFIAEAASSYGLTSFEYRKRSAAAEEYCAASMTLDKAARFTLCREAVLLDIFEDNKNAILPFYSEEKIRDREKIYKAQCDKKFPRNEKKECFIRVMNFKIKEVN